MDIFQININAQKPYKSYLSHAYDLHFRTVNEDVLLVGNITKKYSNNNHHKTFNCKQRRTDSRKRLQISTD